jgi:hypothetical protein
MDTSISADALRRAAAIKEQIGQLEAELNSILSGQNPPARRGRKPGPQPKRTPGRPRKTAPTVHNAAETEPATPRTKKRRKMSPEARARISAAAKARWAREKAGN